MHSLYRSSTRGPEDDSVESKHVAPLSHYMFKFTTVVFDGSSPAFYNLMGPPSYMRAVVGRNVIMCLILVFIDLGTISFSRRNPLPLDSKKTVAFEKT